MPIQSYRGKTLGGRLDPPGTIRVKRLNTGHFCCHGNQFIRECWAKNHDQREEKLRFCANTDDTANTFEPRLEISSPKLPLTPNFRLIY